MVRLPWHQMEVEVGEPLSLGELHEVRLHAAGDLLQCGGQAAYEPAHLVGGAGVSSVNDLTCRVGTRTSQADSVLLNAWATRQ